MVREIWIYIEGGGRNGTEGASALRRGFRGFFGELMSIAKQNNIIWQNIACGGRQQAYTDFVTEREDSAEEVLHILLVDSGGPVDPDCPHWKYLRERKEDQWELCEDDEKYLHLMVQAMEAWLIADRKALREFYGEGFKEEKLPDDDIENIPKKRLVISLKAATRRTEIGTYHKIQHAFDILATLDPPTVRNAAPHCDQLFQVLEKQVGIARE